MESLPSVQLLGQFVEHLLKLRRRKGNRVTEQSDWSWPYMTEDDTAL